MDRSETAQQSSVAALAMPSKPTGVAAAPAQSERRWNTKNLGLRAGVDFVSAACAASLVAPLIAIIDRSVMENASGRNTLVNSLKSSLADFIVRPQSILFSKPLALIFMVYGSTYLAANGVDTTHSTLQNRPATTVTSGTTKFAASSATNIGLTIYKDQVFVRLFGPPGALPRAVPLTSLSLFALRDSMTIFASFNVPPLLGPYLNAHFSDGLRKHVSGLSTAQFLAPAAIQFISTPLHLLGLDLYNRPATTAESISMRERFAIVRKNWTISSFARIGRIVPAFGFGGVVNTKVRRSLMEKLE